ncbi:MAG: hypothetical protein WC313_00995 [Candidatus Kapaibacterium sp.]|nr:hypothetical protein [Candidatus Kapabacteria bacterium]
MKCIGLTRKPIDTTLYHCRNLLLVCHMLGDNPQEYGKLHRKFESNSQIFDIFDRLKFSAMQVW